MSGFIRFIRSSLSRFWISKSNAIESSTSSNFIKQKPDKEFQAFKADLFSPGAMDVLKTNFSSEFERIEKSIECADFVAIDGEFTGLASYKELMPFDDPDERYERIRESCSKFLLIQFGLCTFQYDEKTDKFTNSVFNFYVWPRPYNREAPDPKFTCLSSSMGFLSAQNFDFNKLFKDGVSYVKREELEAMKTALIEKREAQKDAEEAAVSDVVEVPPEQTKWLSDVTERIKDFVKSGEDSHLDVEKSNGFQRKLVHQLVRQHGEWSKSLHVDKISNQYGYPTLRIKRFKPGETKEKLYAEKTEAELKQLEEQALGFTRVIEKLRSSQKLVVGHNMMLDLAFTLAQFVSVLPDSLKDFKSLSAQTFSGGILDTKLMAATQPLKDEIPNSALEELRRITSESPYEPPIMEAADADCGYDNQIVEEESKKKYHEAGYDAYVTGLCFISLFKRLRSMSQDKNSALKSFNLESPLLQPFINKVYMMKMTDIPYLTLDPTVEDALPDRGHVFHLTFPSNWKTSDIKELFSPLELDKISWVDNNSAFVVLKDKEEAAQVMPKFSVKSSDFSVMPFAQFKAFERVQKMSTSTSGITPTIASARFMSTSAASASASGSPHQKSSPFKLDRRPQKNQTSSKNGSGVKRSVSPTSSDLKRQKSEDQKPVFQEADSWN